MAFHARLWLVYALAAACLSACAGGVAARANVSQIVSTTSFGMCAGYCTTRLEVSEGQAVLVRQARGGRGVSDAPDQRTAAPLTPDEWQEIARLAASADLRGLPPVIGCPDCADGGAESLAITSAGETRAISFEYGAAIAKAQPLLERLRALRTQLAPE